MRPGTAVTHVLESRGQAPSAGLKYNKVWQPLTPWRAKDRHHQQASNAAMQGSHSLPGEPRSGVVSMPDMQQGMAATHRLESQGQALSAGLKSSQVRQPCTSWRAKDKRHQQA